MLRGPRKCGGGNTDYGTHCTQLLRHVSATVPSGHQWSVLGWIGSAGWRFGCPAGLLIQVFKCPLGNPRGPGRIPSRGSRDFFTYFFVHFFVPLCVENCFQKGPQNGAEIGPKTKSGTLPGASRKKAEKQSKKDPSA